MFAADEVTASEVAAAGAMGVVAASIESMNLMTCARLAASLRVSLPPVSCASMRHVLPSPDPANSAEPLWKNVCGNANSESGEAGANPSAPSGAAPFCRTSLNAWALNVPTLRNLRDQLRVGDQAGVGRRREAHAAGGPLRAAVATLAVGLNEQLPPRGNVRIGGTSQRRDWRTDAALNVGFDRIPGRHAAHLELIASAAR